MFVVGEVLAHLHLQVYPFGARIKCLSVLISKIFFFQWTSKADHSALRRKKPNGHLASSLVLGIAEGLFTLIRRISRMKTRVVLAKKAVVYTLSLLMVLGSFSGFGYAQSVTTSRISVT